MEQRADQRFSAQMGRYGRDRSVTSSLNLGRCRTGWVRAGSCEEAYWEATKTFGASARWNGARISVSRHRWVDINETDR